jgi:hypothetical protein
MALCNDVFFHICGFMKTPFVLIYLNRTICKLAAKEIIERSSRSHIISWKKISRDNILDEHFMYTFREKIVWKIVSKNQTLSCNIMDNVEKYLDWNLIQKYQIFDKPIIDKYKQRLDIIYLASNNRIDDKNMILLANDINWNTVCKNNIYLSENIIYNIIRLTNPYILLDTQAMFHEYSPLFDNNCLVKNAIMEQWERTTKKICYNKSLYNFQIDKMNKFGSRFSRRMFFSYYNW